MNKQFKFTDWSLRFSLFAAFTAVLSVLGHRFDLVNFQPALLGLAMGTVLAVMAIVLGLIGTWRAVRAKKADIASTTAGSTLGLLVAIPVLTAILNGIGAPLIHDITTDLEHPPEFVEIKTLRESTHNSLDRLEPEDLADVQKQHYPDLKTLVINRSAEDVFNLVVALVKNRDWKVAVISAATGRIEATDVTPMMGFKDDIVIRVQAMGNQTRIDMRSASRVGKGDLGVNANRIQLFFADLSRLINTQSDRDPVEK